MGERKRILKKICMLGDFAVGKTSLIRRYVLDEFDDRYITTLGTKITKKTLDLEDMEFAFQIWDIIGNVNYNKIQSKYYSGSNGAFVIFDITRPETFENLTRWADMFLEVEEGAKLVMIGNKVDLDATFPYEEGIAELAEDYGARFFTTSAKTGENVEEAFRALAGLMLGRDL